jgi:FkbM family methyltransferase
VGSDCLLQLGRVKDSVRRAIARHRRSSLVTAVHKAAAFVESAWHNEGADFDTNGERFVLERLRAAEFQVALDVGANVGHWAEAALALWPRCHVHAFEIAPKTFAGLEANARTWPGADRARLHQLGLSDNAGILPMYYYPDRHELTSDTPRHEGLTTVPFEARVTTLDQFCSDQRIDHIDYLKIDVEGAEHRVLKGASAFLQAKGIACIQFEYGSYSIDSRVMLRDYFGWLGQSHVIGKIFPNHVAFTDYDWTMESLRFSNYLCVSRQREDLQKLVAG